MDNVSECKDSKTDLFDEAKEESSNSITTEVNTCIMVWMSELSDSLNDIAPNTSGLQVNSAVC